LKGLSLSGIILLVVVLSGCSSQTPECGGSDSIDLVRSIAKEHNVFKRYIFDSNWDNVTNNDESLKVKREALKKTNRIGICWFYASGLYDGTPNACGENYVKAFKNYRSALLSNYKDIKYTLENIITTSKDDELRNSMCKAKLIGRVDNWGGAEREITYKLEINSEGNLAIEVFGIR